MANASAAVMLAGQAARKKAVQLALTGRDAPFAGAGEGVRCSRRAENRPRPAFQQIDMPR
jgi:hypothetical protein